MFIIFINFFLSLSPKAESYEKSNNCIFFVNEKYYYWSLPGPWFDTWMTCKRCPCSSEMVADGITNGYDRQLLYRPQIGNSSARYSHLLSDCWPLFSDNSIQNKYFASYKSTVPVIFTSVLIFNLYMWWKSTCSTLIGTVLKLFHCLWLVGNLNHSVYTIYWYQFWSDVVITSPGSNREFYL